MEKLMERKLKDYAVLMLKGMGMGAADVVPGVSGGTIAFIVGIYDELINSIKSINLESLKLFFSGKWTLKELLLHLIDTEKIFQYRALRFARKDQTELSGFDENLFVENSFANDRTLVSLLEEFRIVRQTSIIFFENLQNAALTNTGKANGNEISVETIGRLIVGHNFHHLKIIEERYLPNLK
jgi:hypothetical protein